MTFDEKYPDTFFLAEPEPNLILMKERGNEEYCAGSGCSIPTRWFDIDTQQYACSEECLASLRANDALLAQAEDDTSQPSRLTNGRIEQNWMDRQAAIELRDLLKEHPEFAEQVENLEPGEAIVRIYQQLGGEIS